MPAEPEYIRNLRRRAEQLLSETIPKQALLSGMDLQRLVHELSVHQVELEMQNEELRRSQVQLEESRSEYADLYDFAPVGYLTFDETGLITRANLTITGLLGLERSHLIQKPITLFVDPGSQDLFYFHKRKAFETTAKQTCQLVLKRKDGTLFDAQMESIAAAVNGRLVVNSIITDITEHKQAEWERDKLESQLRRAQERKQAEDALRESEIKLRAILDGSRDAIGVSKDGIHTFANPAYVSLFGYENAEELIGVPIIDLIAPESRSFVSEMVKRRARGEPVPTLYEVTALKKDGTTFLMEATISSYVLNGEQFTLAILRDITGRRRAEDEIRMLKHSIDVHYDGAYWMNTDNEFVYVNEAACKALGYAREELLGKTLYQVNPSATAQGMRDVWEGLRKGGAFITESVHRRKDGSQFPVEITTTYVRFGGREFACGFARDITEKKKLEEQLRQAQKMEAIGTLAGGVAHDFNNILTIIMGLGNLIQMTIDKEDLLRPHIDQIVASSERAADLTQSLLAFSRKQQITLESYPVNGVVTSTAKLLKRLLPEDIKITMNFTEEETFSPLDVTQIGQVLMNLATNARDAMPHGGALTISTERVLLDENFKKTHGFGRPGPYVKLSLSDTGAGMDERTMERIFEPFFSTKEVGKGTGLGLASAYGIVKQHNGYITVWSRPSKGTTFDIYLPFIDRPPQQEAPAAGEIERGAETILIVEDDRDVRNMLTKILESHGYSTMDAGDGDEAVKIHQEHKDRIDLIILDLVMPGKNGKEVLDEISRTDPRVKAIFLSGYAGDIVIDKGIQSESIDFLQKPLSIATLLTKVREVLDR